MTCGYKDPPELVEAVRIRNLIEGAHALVIRFENGRYFSEFGPARMVTAWSICGAKLFGAGDTFTIGKVEKRLEKLGKEWTRVRVRCVEDLTPWRCADCGYSCTAAHRWCPICSPERQ